ncbi:neuferricin homolog [Topomyia yanbarensis]|uniref:neuferricin homolog n=1 Tax=Topomyia yanbarensis TaxID=2498891 RepID=UPI00273A98A0|nr:neuferricin homolog [Topomyia yanbarensis]
MIFAYLKPYFRHLIVIGLAVLLFVILSREPEDIQPHQQVDRDEEISSDVKLFTDIELEQYNGREGSPGLYLVILGYVYDVASGVKHYGPGEAYNMFVGHDASRSFISGEFEAYHPEMSDVSSLTDGELKSLVKWKSFYDETYVYKGKLIGRYFDDRGRLTDYHKVILERAIKAEQKETEPRQQYPSCNVEWKEETGTRVWCTSRSGDGVERGWVGKPRRYAKEPNPYCVCVPDDVSTSDTSLAPFADCDVSSESCFVMETKTV